MRSTIRKSKVFEGSTEITSGENSPRFPKDTHIRTQSQERIIGNPWQNGTVLVGPDEESDERGIVKTTEIGISYDDGESAPSSRSDEDKDVESRYHAR